MAALTAWRAADSTQSSHPSELVTDATLKLRAAETLVAEDNKLVLTIAVRARFRGGRTHIFDGGNAVSGGPDKTLIKALARAHRWRQMLERGEVTSIDDLARRVGQERRHVGGTLQLAFLSPELTTRILSGTQPGGLRLAHLLDTDIPLSWFEQRCLFT